MNSEQLNETIEQSGFTSIGLRVMTGGAKIEVGDALDNSFVWEDGDCTTEQLDGACALDLEFDGWDIDEERFNKMMDQAKQYALLSNDEQIVIIGGDESYEGNDPDEVVILDAECIAVI